MIPELIAAQDYSPYAMGRMQLSVRTFALGLRHMGFDTYIV